MKTYNEDKTKFVGAIQVSYKIDGVQAIVKDGIVTSRAGKPLYNLPPLEDGKYEIFLGTWNESVSAVRTHEGKDIHSRNIYQLEPELDERLLMTIVEDGNRTNLVIDDLFNTATALGYEGLVLKDLETGEQYKVKGSETHDVMVEDVIPGKGKHTGKIGALVTRFGKVGTGLTDSDREKDPNDFIGEVIEVGCMSMTKDGKFRHPRFLRLREDR
jgi:hypothetical protein